MKLKTLLFILPLFITLLIEGAYKTFFLKILDSKFNGDLWLNFQVWIAVAILMSIYSGLAFLGLLFLWEKTTKCTISHKMSILIGLLVCICNYSYFYVTKKNYDPLNVSITFVLFIFILINVMNLILKKFKKKNL